MCIRDRILSYSQALLTITQTPAGSGIYTITYNDSANGWAFYDPYSQPIGVYSVSYTHLDVYKRQSPN